LREEKRMPQPVKGQRERAKGLIEEVEPELLDEVVAYLEGVRAAASDSRGLMATIGLRPVSKGEGRSAMMVTPAPHLMNPHGVLHGAVLFAAMDTAMGGAVTSLLGDGETCATIEAKINYLAPVTGGRLTATATVIQKGGRVVVAEARATTEDGRLAGVMIGTFIILRGEQA